MSFVISQMVRNAQADIGYYEGPNNRNKYTEWQTYGRILNSPYCASATSKWAYDAGFRFDASCTWQARGDWNVTAQRQWAQRHGIWRDRWTHAQPGWMSVQSYGIPDQHVEMVYRDDGGSVVTIGANAGPMVSYKVRSRSACVGWIALDLAGQSGPAPVEPPAQPDPPEEEPEDVLTISLHTGKFPYPWIALDTKNRKVLGWNGAGVHWDGGKPSSGQHVGSADPRSWTIPGTEPVLSWATTHREGSNDGERVYFVINTGLSSSGNQYKGWLFRR